DVLIGGTTSYDTNTAANNTALLAILGEWLSGDGYTTRISKIRAGLGGATGPRFNSATVRDDALTDTLTGQLNAADLDWFWAGVATNPDALTDRETGEQVN